MAEAAQLQIDFARDEVLQLIDWPCLDLVDIRKLLNRMGNGVLLEIQAVIICPEQEDAMQPLEHGTTLETKSVAPPAPDPTVRKLKIEADGDPWKGLTKPKIRLTGRWLERAGFSAGNRVHVTCLAPGVIELRSADDVTMNETARHSQI